MTDRRLTAADLAVEEASVTERAKRKQRWSKDQRASETPSASHFVSRAHEDALFVDAMPSRYRGMASIFALGLLTISTSGFYASGKILVEMFEYVAAAKIGVWLVLFDLLLIVIIGGTALISLITALRAFRFDLLAPKEIPIIFNRRTRKVYRYVQDVPGLEIAFPDGKFSFKGLLRYLALTFQPWPDRLLIEYDWDCLEAEYHETTRFTGQVIHTDCHLDLFVRAAPGGERVIGSFGLAPSLMVSEQGGRDLWEHVRRFMEEHGPVLSPGDEPADPAPRGFWQAANAPFAGPGWLVFLAGAIWTRDILYWKIVFNTVDRNSALWHQAIDHSIQTGVVKNLVFFLCYFFMAWVFFAVLAAYLSPGIKLPEEVLREAGEPVDLKALAKAQAGEAKTPGAAAG